MQFPDLLLVEVRSAATDEPIPDILVWISTLVRERAYYCALVGLTDSLGIARLSRVELLKSYRSDQQLFPMDYKLSLAECDDAILVGVDGKAANVQECHLVAVHLLSAAVDDALAAPTSPAFPEVGGRSAGPRKLVLVGDLLVDETLRGEVERICPDGPVPVVQSLRRPCAREGPGWPRCWPPRTGTTSR